MSVTDAFFLVLIFVSTFMIIHKLLVTNLELNLVFAVALIEV